jgi:hypothetical protein
MDRAPIPLWLAHLDSDGGSETSPSAVYDAINVEQIRLEWHPK